MRLLRKRICIKSGNNRAESATLREMEMLSQNEESVFTSAGALIEWEGEREREIIAMRVPLIAFEFQVQGQR